MFNILGNLYSGKETLAFPVLVGKRFPMPISIPQGAGCPTFPFLHIGFDLYWRTATVQNYLFMFQVPRRHGRGKLSKNDGGR